MERVFSIQGYSHIVNRIVQKLTVKDLSNLSKVSKSLASSTAKLWFPRFLKKYRLEPQLEEFYVNLMAYPNPDILQSLGNIMRIRVEHGVDIFYKMNRGSEFQLQHEHELISQTNCPLELSIIFNQTPLAQLILNEFPNVVKVFSRAVKLAIYGDRSIDIFKSLLGLWKENYPHENKNLVLDFAAKYGTESKFQILLDFGLDPSTEYRIGIEQSTMDVAVSNRKNGIVKILLPYYKNLDSPMKLAIRDNNEKMIEILFDHCKVPSSRQLSDLSNCSWTYHAAILGKDLALQKLIALEKKSPLPSSDEQFSYLSDIITKASASVEG